MMNPQKIIILFLFRDGITKRWKTFMVLEQKSGQTFEGVIMATNGVGISKTITVRKLSFGVGVERIFPIHAPIIDSIEVIRKGKVRRSKLYYLRDRIGKSAKIKEDRK